MFSIFALRSFSFEGEKKKFSRPKKIPIFHNNFTEQPNSLIQSRTGKEGDDVKNGRLSVCDSGYCCFALLEHDCP
jgi:hypothetical protein